MAKHQRSTLLKCPTCKQDWPDDADHALRAFGWLDPLPRSIRPSNFDGIIAVIHDRVQQRFLVLEAKGHTEPIDAGQVELLRALASVPGFTVRVLRGTPEAMVKHVVTAEGIQPGVVTTAAEARDGIWRWFGVDPEPGETSADVAADGRFVVTDDFFAAWDAADPLA